MQVKVDMSDAQCKRVFEATVEQVDGLFIAYFNGEDYFTVTSDTAEGAIEQLKAAKRNFWETTRLTLAPEDTHQDLVISMSLRDKYE